MAKTKDVVWVIESSGKQSQRKPEWVLKHELLGNGYWIGRVFHFYAPAEIEQRRTEARRLKHAPISRAANLLGQAAQPVILRPNEPTPSTGGAPFLPYPMPRATGGRRGLRAQYPTLAKAGAGL